MITKSTGYKLIPFPVACLLSACRGEENTITGLYYAGSRPVAIIIKDGTISDIRQLKNLPEENHDLIISP